MPTAKPHLPTAHDTYGFPPEAFDRSRLPDIETDFISSEDVDAFVRALQAPDPLQSPATTILSTEDGLQSPTALLSNGGSDRGNTPEITKRHSQLPEPEPSRASAVAASAAAAGGDLVPPTMTESPILTPTLQSRASRHMFFTARHDWAPVNAKVSRRNGADGSGPAPYSNSRPCLHQTSNSGGGGTHKRGSAKRRRRAGRAAAALLGERNKDETREGYLYVLFKWPLLIFCGAWLACLAIGYALTRSYIFLYEHFFTWRGRRERLRRNMTSTSSYSDWVAAAKQLDVYLGRQAWKEENAFAYYDSKTVKSVWEQMRRMRRRVQAAEASLGGAKNSDTSKPGAEELRALLEACVKNNFVGISNAHLYSQTYYGTKNLVQNFTDELEKSLEVMLETKQIDYEEKRDMFKRLHANYGRTALCLSGGAAFAYYHFGIIRALLDADLLPDVITGTSGGALVAALVATRTNDELKELLVPALAYRIDACSEPFTTWIPRWWRTGARFDSVDWAKRCSWWSRGSMTFREAYMRTGRILNVSCVPADAHSPAMLCNYLTAPDCVIWSAVLASAAVPGILNPVVLMMKQRDGTLSPYSFGHKWKDGSLRTDIPIRSLNLHFNVNFTIVSQVNPHVNLFFFAARGRVGGPVTHRKGRGWRGGFLMSALEHWIRLDMNKWLRFVRAAEILPRPLGQDWSQLWLQQFNGTITLWPKTAASDFWRILTDPDEARLARMIHEGLQCAFPVLKFVDNRLKVERLVERGWRETRAWVRRGSIETVTSDDELKGHTSSDPEGLVGSEPGLASATEEDSEMEFGLDLGGAAALSLETEKSAEESDAGQTGLMESETEDTCDARLGEVA